MDSHCQILSHALSTRIFNLEIRIIFLFASLATRSSDELKLSTEKGYIQQTPRFGRLS
jgi:hypothetical protein